MREAARIGSASALVAGLAVLSWTAGLASAAADPIPPVDPLIPAPAPADPGVPPPAEAAPPPAAPQTLLGQFAQAAQLNPLDSMKELMAGAPQQAAIGLAPSTPGAAPVPDPWTMAQLLRPQNYRMPTPDQISPYALAPNDNPSPFARIDAWKGVHAMVHSNLGRMPGDELGQPLPGTAPPPGTNIPPGLEQFYAPPGAASGSTDPSAVPVAPPADPLLLPPASPPPPN